MKRGKRSPDVRSNCGKQVKVGGEYMVFLDNSGRMESIARIPGDYRHSLKRFFYEGLENDRFTIDLNPDKIHYVKRN